MAADCFADDRRDLLWAATCKLGTEEYQSMSVGKAFIIGLAQAVAILPGISRSGTTSRPRPNGTEFASVRHCFVHDGVVAIGGAGLVESIKMFRHPFRVLQPLDRWSSRFVCGTAHCGWVVYGTRRFKSSRYGHFGGIES